MSHVDEGTLHAWLDGELTAAEGAELERHLSVCVPCRAALAEARTFLSESDGMIRALDVMAPGTAIAIPAPRPRLVRFTTLAWAASILLAIGLGYSLRTAPLPLTPSGNAVDEGGAKVDLPASPIVAPSPSPAASAPTTAPQRQGTGELRGGRRDLQALSTPAPDQKVDAIAQDAATDAAPAANAGAGVAPASVPRSALSQPAPAAAAGAAAPSESRAARPSPIAMIEGVPVDTTATHRAFGPPHPPAPRRITMDEAVTHLGGTIRLIDGLTPQRVELLAGVDVAGADPAREVVRIYYEEPDLGLVTLDQQRPGPSFAASRLQSEVAPESVTVASSPAFAFREPQPFDRPAIASLTWRSDGAWLSLTSRLPKDRMASLQARVK